MRIPRGLMALFLTAACLPTTGCGGAGSDSTQATPSPVDTAPPQGLTERPSLAALSLPGDHGSAQDAPVQLSSRYPAIAISQALWTRQVPGTDRLLVLSQNGRGYTFVDTPESSTTSLVLNLTSQTRSEGELGLLGAAFAPNFVTNRFIYFHYNPADEPLRSRIARFSWTGATIDPASELVILEVDQPFANHNGGSIEFGPDDMLYIALGDGGSGGDPQNNAQNTGNLLGAILRIDVSQASNTAPYEIPPDNPWAMTSGSRGELWAIGLRNPYRVSFDQATGELWAGDVGQADREEIDIITGGGNYGWRVFEGTLPFNSADNSLPDSAFNSPIIDLPRNLARSITGGDVYRGNRLPALNGSYIYGDFATDNIWSLQRNPGDAPTNTLLGSVTNPAFFGTDSNNETLITSYTAGFFGLDPGSGLTTAPETLLSGTGLFSDLVQLTPTSGLIEYAVNEPAWTDGTGGMRWLAVPDDATIDFSADEPWTFPAGSLFVQQINLNTVDRGLLRLETRILIVGADNDLMTFTYAWNDDQSDALLITQGSQRNVRVTNSDGEELTFSHTIPSQGECLGCHNAAASRILGAAQTKQLNALFNYPDVEANQLHTFNSIDLFDNNIFAIGNETAAEDYSALPPSSDAAGATLAARARSYLDVNCAQCHRANGPTGSTLDLRSNIAERDLNAINIAPSAGDLGLTGAQLIAPGDSASSVLLERMRVLDGNRMPPVGSNRVDEAGVALIQDWIDSL